MEALYPPRNPAAEGGVVDRIDIICDTDDDAEFHLIARISGGFLAVVPAPLE